jgi:RecJ-like exonuclease
MKEVDGFPRRNRLDLNTAAEKAIYDAIQAVEKSGADVRLTEAVIKLTEARNLVADVVDEQIEKTSGLSPQRKLVYMFISLPYHKQFKIAHQLGLVEDGDVNIEEKARNILIYQRVVEKNLLKEMWDIVVTMNPSPFFNVPNPF